MRKGLYITLCSVFMICGAFFSYAQEKERASIYGFVQLPEKDYNPLFVAEVFLVGQADTLKTLTGLKEHGFVFKGIRPGEYFLEINSIGYESFRHSYTFEKGDNIVYVQLTTKHLDAAVVKADIPVMKQVGDTTVYYAAAARVAEEENAMELLQRMPGFEVRRNEIYHNGGKVARTYVNGMLVFGDAPVNAFNHMLAGDVTQIKVYQEDSKEDVLNGYRAPRKEKVLDVRTREPVINAADIYAMAQGGADAHKNADGNLQPRYAGGITANFFSEKFLADANLYANNLGYGSNLQSLTGAPSGALHDRKDAIHAGVGIQKYWGDRYRGNHFSLRYSYDRTHTDNFSHTLSDYYSSESSPALSYSDTSSNSSVAGSHSVAFSLFVPDSPVFSINSSGHIRFEDHDSESFRKRWGGITGQNNPITDMGQNTGSKGWDGDFHIQWSDRRAEHRLRPSALFSANAGRHHALTASVDTLESSSFRQYLNLDDNSDSFELLFSPSLSWMIENAVSCSSELSLGYTLSKTKKATVRAGMDFLPDKEHPHPDPVNTFHHNWNLLGHTASLSYHRSTGISGGLDGAVSFNITEVANTEDLASHQLFSKRYWSVLPSFLFRQTNKWKISVDTERIYPSWEQTRPLIDNSSPQSLRAGNPDLKAPYLVNSAFGFYPALDLKSGFLSISSSFRFVINSIVSYRKYFSSATVLPEYGNLEVPAGAFLYTYQNANPSLNTSLSFNWSNRGKKMTKLILFETFTVQYKTSPQYTSDILIQLHEPGATNHLRLVYSPDKNLALRLTSNTVYAYAFADRSDLRLHTVTENLSVSLTKYFWKTLKVVAQYNWHHTSYIGNGYPSFNMHEANLLIGKSFLKKRLFLSLTANDILNRGAGYSISTTPDSIIRTWTPSFGRYYLLSVSYRFNRLGKETSFKGTLNKGDR